MIDVTCEDCSKTLRVADTAAGKRGKCPQCGSYLTVPIVEAPVELSSPVPTDGAAPSQTRSPSGKKPSGTERALAAALKAMDEKESAGGRAKSNSRTTYDLGTKSDKRLQTAQRTPTNARKLHAEKPGQAAPLSTRKIGANELKRAGMIGGALVLAIVAWQVLTPSSEESDQGKVIVHLKDEADKLASEGKLAAAYESYDRIRLVSAGRDFKSSSLKQTLDAALKARNSIRASNPDLFARAKTAKSSG
jgi:phage FluMu protein Com